MAEVRELREQVVFVDELRADVLQDVFLRLPLERDEAAARHVGEALLDFLAGGVFCRADERGVFFLKAIFAVRLADEVEDGQEFLPRG